MQRIEILPELLIGQIAAGEVVERPAAVVKELVENALDAEATRIDVRASEGGVLAISVRDDGWGMTEADAKLAFRRHATSKIRDLEGLSRVTTLGFRGEALPSIAAVARVRMQTRRASDALGVELRLRGGETAEATPSACPAGTYVEVAELFHSVPARRKFLKSPATEMLHIVRWLEEIALVRSDVRFELERDGRPCLRFLATEDPRERVIAVLPGGLGERLLPLAADTGAARVRGFASPTDLMRASANDIHLFVNGRPVRDRVLLSAVRDGYRDALPSGRHPALVLMLELPPEDVDANVHPSKVEVRFRESRAVHQLVQGAIAAAVGARSRPRAPSAAGRAVLPADWRLPPEAGFVADAAQAPEPGTPPGPAPAAAHAFASLQPLFAGAAVRSWPAAATGRARPPLREHRFAGQLFGTYLALERDGAVVLLDQHAAHERVLFEQLRERALARKLRLESQALLVPVWLELPRSHAAALAAHREDLAAAGFELEWGPDSLRGGERIAVRSLPVLLKPLPGRAPLDFAALLEETAAGLVNPQLREQREGLDGAIHHVLATAACHAAVRKGDRMRPEEVEALAAALDDGIEFANCPHGRPLAWTLEERELARHFLRPVS